MALLTKKIKGSTLIEAMVAMIIVMISFGIAMSIFINVGGSDNQVEKYKAQLLLKEEAIKTVKDNLYLDEIKEAGSITINKSVTPYNGINELHLMLLQAFNEKGEKIAERKELVIVK